MSVSELRVAEDGMGGAPAGGRKPRRRSTGSRLGYRELVLALFLTAGAFKGDPRLEWLPVDLTLLTALATVALVAKALVERGFRVPRAVFVLLLFFVSFVPTMFWTEWHAYATEKSVRFFTLTVLATIAPALLIRTRDALRRLLNAFALLGILMAADAMLSWMAGGRELVRLSAFGATSISLGRGAGMALLWSSIRAVEGRMNPIVAWIVIGILGSVLFASGSRGPLFGAIVASVVTFVWFLMNRLSRLVRVAVIIAVSVVTIDVVLPVVPSWSLLRIENLLSGQLGLSELSRLDAYALSWRIIQEAPLGVGLGGFATRSNLWIGAWRQFPHNILLEVFVEGGWLAGTYFIGVMVLAFRKAVVLAGRDSGEGEGAGLFALLVFVAINEMVSGELNDSKLLFALLGVTMGCPWVSGEAQGRPDSKSAGGRQAGWRGDDKVWGEVPKSRG